MSESEKLAPTAWVPSFRTDGRWSRESRGGSRGHLEGPARKEPSGYHEAPAKNERQSLSEVKSF
jgi:hypothetical protein